MGFNHCLMFATLNKWLNHLELSCTLTIETWLKSSMHFDCKYLGLRNVCTFSLVYIVLDVRDGTESKYPSIVFSEYILKCGH